jgi:hypothetical protein
MLQPRMLLRRRRHSATAALVVGSTVGLCLILCLCTPTANAFASNLIVTSMGCMTELSTDEVIMNNEVKAAADSDFPKMHLVVIDSVNNNHMESPYHFTTSPELTIAFVNPYTKEEFADDLQFVMEVDGPASFIEGGTIGCENDKRVAARWIDDDGKVVLKINDMSAKLRVWAGWATGQNPVRLTPELLLEPAPEQAKHVVVEEEGDSKKSDSKEEAVPDIIPLIDQTRDLEKATKVELPTPDANAARPFQNLLTNNRVPKELDNIDPSGRSGGHHNAKQKIVHRDSSRSGGAATRHRENIVQKIREQHGLDLAAVAESIKKTQVKRAPPTKTDDGTDDDTTDSKEMDRRRKESDQVIKRHRTYLEAHMRNDFSNAANDLSLSSHLLGCAFFVVCIGSLLLVFSKKRDKGRRDL